MRRCAAVLALIGVLLHAVAIVRHNAVMLSAGGSVLPHSLHAALSDAAATADLAADLNLLCHAGSDADQTGDPRDGAKSSCPICSGLCPLVMLPPPGALFLAAAPPAAGALDVPRDLRVETHLRIRPPSRGPPSLT